MWVLLSILLYLVVGAAIAVATYQVLQRLTVRSLLRARLRSVIRDNQNTAKRSLLRGMDRLLPSAVLDRMIASFNERRSVSALSISWPVFLLVSALMGAGGFILGWVHFRNLLAGIGLGLMGLLLPDQILSMGAGAHRDKTHEQFQLAVQIFAAEYRAERSVQRAFLRAVPQLPEPIRSHFDRAARRLNNGEPHIQVLDDLADRLGHPFAGLFVSNCKAVMEHQGSGPLFDNIAHQLNQWRIRQTANAAALSGGKATGLILNGALPIVYLVQVRVQPNTHAFLTETAGGRGLLVLMLIGVLLTFGLNNLLAKAEW